MREFVILQGKRALNFTGWPNSSIWRTRQLGSFFSVTESYGLMPEFYPGDPGLTPARFKNHRKKDQRPPAGLYNEVDSQRVYLNTKKKIVPQKESK